MSILHFLRILWARRALVLLTAAAALVAAVLVIKIVPPRYTATSRLMLEIMKPDPVTGQALSSQFARAFVATQVELIKDYRVAGRVVDNFNWTSSPALAANYRASAPTGDMDFRRWLADRVISSTEVALVPGSNIMEISYTSDNPETAAKVADALRDAYEQETRLQRQRGAQRSAEWFVGQTNKLRAQLAQAEEKKTAFERANGVIVQDDLEDSESARLKALSTMQDTPAMPAMGGGVPIIAPSQSQLQQIDIAIQSAMSTLGPNHPRILALRQQRAATAQLVQQELAAARAAARPAAAASGPSVAQLYSQQAAKVLAQRGKIGEARQLAVDVMVLREQVQNTAKRAAQLQQESESTETGLSFLGSATAPRKPSFPNIPLITLGAMLMGLALGIGLAILIELLNRKVRGPADLSAIGIPMLGMAELAPSKPKPTLLQRATRLLPYRNEAAA